MRAINLGSEGGSGASRRVAGDRTPLRITSARDGPPGSGRPSGAAARRIHAGPSSKTTLAHAPRDSRASRRGFGFAVERPSHPDGRRGRGSCRHLEPHAERGARPRRGATTPVVIATFGNGTGSRAGGPVAGSMRCRIAIQHSSTAFRSALLAGALLAIARSLRLPQSHHRRCTLSPSVNGNAMSTRQNGRFINRGAERGR